jgi:hypothetical protein
MKATTGQRDAARNSSTFVTDPSLTIQQFCAAETMSRAMVYALWKADKGPRYFYVGAHRRISAEARREWRQRLEAEAAQPRNGATVEAA